MVVGDAPACCVQQVPSHHGGLNEGYSAVEGVGVFEVVVDEPAACAVDKGPAHDFVFDEGVAFVEVVDGIVVVGKSSA